MSTTLVYGKPTLQALKEACQVFTYQKVMYEIVELGNLFIDWLLLPADLV